MRRPFADVGAVRTLLRTGRLNEGMTMPRDCSESDVSFRRAEDGRLEDDDEQEYAGFERRRFMLTSTGDVLSEILPAPEDL